MAKREELNAQERRFCYEYLVDLNQTAAYIRAGYTTNYQSAAASATLKIKEKKIADFIDYLKKEREERTAVSADKVVQELAKIAFFDPRRLMEVKYEKDGSVKSSLKDVSEMSPEDSAVISEITERVVSTDKDDKGKTTTVIDRKYKLHSKTQALEQLGKHTGIYEKDNNQKTFAQVVISLPSNGRETKEKAD